MRGYQGMVCLAGNQIWWTWEVEDVFKKVKQGQKQAMKDFAKKQNAQIDDLVTQVLLARIYVNAIRDLYVMLNHYNIIYILIIFNIF